MSDRAESKRADKEKLGTGPERLAERGSDLPSTTNEETGQTLISGMGELHLEIIVDRLKREFNVDANVGRPQVAYRETAGRDVESIREKFVRQTGGSGQYADVVINLRAQEPGEGYEFSDKIVGGKIPTRVHPRGRRRDQGGDAVGRGRRLPGRRHRDRARRRLVPRRRLERARVQDRRLDGVQGGAQALQPKLLEPMMAVEVTTPEDYLGDVIGNLSSRRGRIESMEPVGNAQVVKALVPLSEMFGYSTDLRSMSQGRADYHMDFDRYEEVPQSIAAEITESGASS